MIDDDRVRVELPPCPRCRAPVQPDWDWCQACGFDPERLRPPAVATTPEGADRSSAPAPPEQSGRRVWVLLGVAGVLAFGLLLAGLVRRLDGEHSSASSTLSVPTEWVSFAASDGRVAAAFPQSPTEDEQGLAVEGAASIDVGLYADENADWAFLLMVSEPGAAAGIELSQVAGGLAIDVGGQVVSQRSTDVAGEQAQEVTIEAGERTVTATVAVVNDRLVVIEYIAARPDRELFDRFRKSVSVG